MNIEEVTTTSHSTINSVEKISSEILKSFRTMVETMEHRNVKCITGPEVEINQKLMVVNEPSNSLGVVLMVNPLLVYSDENKIIIEYNNSISGEVQNVIFVGDIISDIKTGMKQLGH